MAIMAMITTSETSPRRVRVLTRATTNTVRTKIIPRLLVRATVMLAGSTLPWVPSSTLLPSASWAAADASENVLPGGATRASRGSANPAMAAPFTTRESGGTTAIW